jgi:hypothetical protein
MNTPRHSPLYRAKAKKTKHSKQHFYDIKHSAPIKKLGKLISSFSMSHFLCPIFISAAIPRSLQPHTQKQKKKTN